MRNYSGVNRLASLFQTNLVLGESAASSCAGSLASVTRSSNIASSSTSAPPCLPASLGLRPSRGFASAAAVQGSTISPPSSSGDIASIVRERMVVTEEHRKMLFQKKERDNCPAYVVEALRASMPQGLTAGELWEKVKGKHEGFVSHKTLKDLLAKMTKTGYRDVKVLAVRGVPHWRYILIPRVHIRKLQKAIARHFKRKNREMNLATQAQAAAQP